MTFEFRICCCFQATRQISTIYVGAFFPQLSVQTWSWHAVMLDNPRYPWLTDIICWVSAEIYNKFCTDYCLTWWANDALDYVNIALWDRFIDNITFFYKLTYISYASKAINYLPQEFHVAVVVCQNNRDNFIALASDDF